MIEKKGPEGVALEKRFEGWDWAEFTARLEYCVALGSDCFAQVFISLQKLPVVLCGT